MEDNLKISKLNIACNQDDLQKKATSKYQKWNISASTDWIILKIKTEAAGTKPKLIFLEMKTTSNGR
jgi:hypothetical protein